MEKTSRLVKNQNGAAMVIAIMVMLVLSILAVTFLNVSFFEEKTAINNEKHKQAYYLARSGQEIAYSMIKKNQGELNSLPEYIYGDLNGNFTLVRGTNNFQGHENESIVTVVEGLNGSGTITSYGNVDGIIEKIVFTFTYGTVLVPGAPPPQPPDGLNAGSADGDAVTWYNSNNGNISHGGGTYDGPVLFQNGSHGAVITLQNSSSTLSAYSMYFLDTPVSLEVSKNSTLTLIVDLLSFSGRVDIDEHNQSDYNGQLILRVNNSEILGQDIGGQAGVKYGVVFFGNDVSLGGTPFGGIDANNYYYFPDGVNINSQSSIDQLIKINDVGTVDLVKLGISQTSGGINPGMYK